MKNPSGLMRGRSEVVLDGEKRADGEIPLADDGATHEVEVTLRAG